jgi:hypothetical protein
MPYTSIGGYDDLPGDAGQSTAGSPR